MNNYEVTRSRLNEVFRDVFDDDGIEIHDSMTAKDLKEWDSLEHITLVLAVEQEFGLKLTTAEVGGLENVGSMIRLLMQRATR